MKFVFIALFFAFNASAFEINPNEAQYKCSKNGIFELTIPTLQLHTKSGLSRVKVDVNQEAICESLKDYFLMQDSLEIEVKGDIYKKIENIRDLSCDGYMCKNLVKKSLGEKVEIQIKRIIFRGDGVVPGSEKLETVEWDSRYCPAWDPRCDF
ncbi:hypothetical protein [Peredibacter starrii]|uniref:Uncharacterized protein n=1 Tax=Peredibacter starrii TaxID=28202 RepID=A0AAX4HLJ5_9BACT|nr:hypothetical protein [Peredibacter starrii]WPU64065.1 hypothetical protein SOO65_15320 [Peredibacter starrii]